MKREIKFRTWDLSTNRWVNINGMDIYFKGCINEGAVYRIYEQGVINSTPIGEIEIMQFTGLKDKNGKEIYEGDIIYNKLYSTPIVVEYKGVGFDFGGMNPYNNSIEIIGNIYQNPKLLIP